MIKTRSSLSLEVVTWRKIAFKIYKIWWLKNIALSKKNNLNPNMFETFESFESNFHLHLRLCQNSSYYRHYLWQVVNWLDLTWVYQTLWLVHQIVQVYKKSTGTTYSILLILNFLKLCLSSTSIFQLPFWCIDICIAGRKNCSALN